MPSVLLNLRNEDGQALPWMVLLMVLFLGMAGITVDLGHAYICYRELQSSTDAAALAAANALAATGASAASVKAAAKLYGSETGQTNANPNLTNVVLTANLQCLSEVSNLGVPCGSSATGDNAVTVFQTAQVPTYFIRVLAVFGANAARSLTLNTIAKAAMAGGDNQEWNVAIVIDSTPSMDTYDGDPNCMDTQMNCAIKGMATLLQSLSPCTASSAGSGTAGSCEPFDQVALFTFPNVKANTAKHDTSCSGGTPTVYPYYEAPAIGATWQAPNYGSANYTYQITDFSYDYSSNNLANGSLNSSSGLAIAAGAGKATKKNGKTKSCPGMQAVQGMDTFYAGSIYAAQSALTAAQASNPSSKNAMIILSDGDANSRMMDPSIKKNGSRYPSSQDQCTQGVNAANYATNNNTTVYVVSYGAKTTQSTSGYGYGYGGGCSTDVDYSITPCQALQRMASSPSTFYSDTSTQAAGTETGCTSQNTVTGLSNIFKGIANSLTHARLIPPTWNTPG